MVSACILTLDIHVCWTGKWKKLSECVNIVHTSMIMKEVDSKMSTNQWCSEWTSLSAYNHKDLEIVTTCKIKL